GEPIVVRTIRLFHDLFPQVLVATNLPERFRGLGVETVADRFPGCGPLAGLHAALLATRHPHVFVAACDMPGLDPGVIRFLLARIGAADAVVPRWEGDVEPLHAIYAAHCLPAMEAREELGVDLAPEPLFPLHYADERTVVHGMVYRARHDGPFRLQPEEIVRGEFLALDAVAARAGREPFCPDGLAALAEYRRRWAAGTSEARRLVP